MKNRKIVLAKVVIKWFYKYHFSFFYSTSVVSNFFTIGLLCDVTMKECKCVIMSSQNKCLLNILNRCDIFFNKSFFFKNNYQKIFNSFNKPI